MLLYYTEQDNILQTLFTLIKCDGFRHIWERIDMIKKKLLKITLITTVIATILVSSGCGKKTADNDETTVQAVTVSAETSSNAAKELTKTGLVTFEYTDPDGNTYTLEGKAVASETGEAVIEVTDAEGNKVTFTGNAKTVDGKLSVSDIAVKDAGTLVKADGNKIEVTTGAIVADASESTEGESNSDIAASDDIKQEVETAKKEESVIEEAKEAVTKAEEIADNTTDNNGGNSDDTIIADNVSNESSDNNQGNIGSSDNNDNAGNTDSNTGSSDNNNSDNNETPVSPTPDETEDKKDETPAPTPADPEPAPAPVDPTPAPEEEKPTEAPTEKATHMETKYIYYHNFDGSIYATDSITYLAYEDGTPVNETLYDENRSPHNPDYDDSEIFMICWMINTGGPVIANNEQMFFKYLNIADYPGNIDMYPGYL